MSEPRKVTIALEERNGPTRELVITLDGCVCAIVPAASSAETKAWVLWVALQEYLRPMPTY